MLGSLWLKKQFKNLSTGLRSTLNKVNHFLFGDNTVVGDKVPTGLKTVVAKSSWFDKLSSWWFELSFSYKFALTSFASTSLGLVGLAFGAPILVMGVSMSLLFLMSHLLMNHHQVKMNVALAINDHYISIQDEEMAKIDELLENFKLKMNGRNIKIKSVPLRYQFVTEETKQSLENTKPCMAYVATVPNDSPNAIKNTRVQKDPIEQHTDNSSSFIQSIHNHFKERDEEQKNALKNLIEPMELLLQPNHVDRALSNKQWEIDFNDQMTKSQATIEQATRIYNDAIESFQARMPFLDELKEPEITTEIALTPEHNEPENEQKHTEQDIQGLRS